MLFSSDLKMVYLVQMIMKNADEAKSNLNSDKNNFFNNVCFGKFY